MVPVNTLPRRAYIKNYTMFFGLPIEFISVKLFRSSSHQDPVTLAHRGH